MALAAQVFAADPGGDSDGGTTNITNPEPGPPPPKHRRIRKPAKPEETTEPKGFGAKQASRRGSSNSVYPTPLPGPQSPAPVPRIETRPHRAAVPPPLFVPETGRTLPNLPSPTGAETSQDKSVRCAHQAGVYGPSATGSPAGYIGSCINQ